MGPRGTPSISRSGRVGKNLTECRLGDPTFHVKGVASAGETTWGSWNCQEMCPSSTPSCSASFPSLLGGAVLPCMLAVEAV